ncbi:phosphatidylinositol phosphate synthase [Nesterenkonia muleiensis]|uniref:phosphatidylinositol phosphate synthase n=1 Tax=Nesterenkonia muleiensis TaxID=2282648 RepID=UPI000E730961|nr:CDP-alcohol phosphatidyltransferase family protein [Nesterenkonia muleiensis]
MMLKHARRFFSAVFTPIARFLLRIGLTPNAVTVLGTLGVSLGALVFYPLGQLFWGTVVITLFVFSDLIDGLMARLADQRSVLGGFLDSISDRVQDCAVFLGLMLWFFGPGDDYWIGVSAAVCMILGLLVSYVRARAESEGFDANTGIAERPERMVLTLVFTGFVGLGMPQSVLLVVLALLATGSLITVVQRIITVVRQATRN